MKRIAAAIGLTVASTTIASAADLPARVYTKAPIAQVYDWTGFYLGANVGIGVSRGTGSQFIDTILTQNPSSVVGGTGAIGGGQLGYNWQAGNIVLGVETDIQGSGVHDNRTCTWECSAGIINAYDQRLDWFGTVRGRVGWATGPVLGYVTGGLAYGDVKTDEMITSAAGSNHFSWDKIKTGWTIGGGMEASLGGNWTGKIEYLYLDLGSQSATQRLGNAANLTASLDIREHIFRAGVNYRFGDKPIVANTSVADWRGLYLGGNAGEGLALSPSTYVVSSPPAIPGVDLYNLSPRGFIGGGQLGYNWQTGAFVFGLETDIQGSTQRGGNACVLDCMGGPLPIHAYLEQRMNWFGTTRGRLGYATGDSLFYVTGGLAYGDVVVNAHEVFETFTPFDGSLSHTKTGYTVGGGIETKLNPFGLFGNNWSVKTEYLYVDLGTVTDGYRTTLGHFSALDHVLTTHTEEHIFRTGLNYHFDSASP